MRIASTNFRSSHTIDGVSRRPRVLFTVVLCWVALLVPAAATGAESARPAGTETTSAATPVATGTTAEGGDWVWPVAGARRLIAPFRAPAHAYGPGHRGMDVAAPVGAEVTAPADGVVAFRGTVVDRPLVTIEHGAGLVSTFEPVASDLSPGDVVVAGEVIGTVATGGHAASGTLHVGVRLNDAYVNPLPLFGEVPRAVLLPCCR